MILQMYQQAQMPQQNSPQFSPSKQTNNQQQFNKQNFGNKKRQRGGKQNYGGAISQNSFAPSNFSEPQPPPVNAYQAPDPYNTAGPSGQNFAQNNYAAPIVNQFTPSANVGFQQPTPNAYQGFPPPVQPPAPQQQTDQNQSKPNVVKKNEGRGASSTISRAPALVSINIIQIFHAINQ